MKAFGLFNKMKQKMFVVFFEKKNSKWPPKKKFPAPPILNIFL